MDLLKRSTIVLLALLIGSGVAACQTKKSDSGTATGSSSGSSTTSPSGSSSGSMGSGSDSSGGSKY